MQAALLFPHPFCAETAPCALVIISVVLCCLGVGAGVLVACSVPLVYNLQLVRTACGPTIGTSMTSALSDAVKRGPS